MRESFCCYSSSAWAIVGWRRFCGVMFLLPLVLGCASKSSVFSPTRLPQLDQVEHRSTDRVALVSYATDQAVVAPNSPESELFTQQKTLADLESAVETNNPRLRQLWDEFVAARARARYVGMLPDPSVGTNVFGHPIETAAGSQRANLTVSQMLPWLHRLDARAEQACFDAMALGQVYRAERLKLVADLRVAWYRLYVLNKQIEINVANQQLLESLIGVANARVATGVASQGDVLVGTLEYSRLEEALVMLRQQLESTKAEINRIVGRNATTSVIEPEQLDGNLPDWNHQLLRELTLKNQPDIETARIRRQASRWGIEVARLERRPDFTVSASWFAIDDNRLESSMVDVGEDAWALGAMMTVPLWHRKYDALESEARWKHAAANSQVEHVVQQYDAFLVDSWAQARAAHRTAKLYETTIIPEARRTLTADQESYSSNGNVEFDRVIGDFRRLLQLEIGYHRSIARQAAAIARIRQAVAVDLVSQPTEAIESLESSSETLGQPLPEGEFAPLPDAVIGQ